MSNVYNAPNSTSVEIHLANNTEASLITALKTCQLGGTTNTGRLVWKDDDDTQWRAPCLDSADLLALPGAVTVATDLTVGTVEDGGAKISYSESVNVDISAIGTNRRMNFKGHDNDNEEFTALVLDMSSGGDATFNNDVTAEGDIHAKTGVHVGGNNVGTADLSMLSISDTSHIRQNTSDHDIVVLVNDGGITDTEALRVKGSDASVRVANSLVVGGSIVKETSVAGLFASEKIVVTELADDASVALTSLLGAFCEGLIYVQIIGNISYFILLTITNASTGTVISGSGHATADTDNKICVFNNGSDLVLKNRAGAPSKFEIHYFGQLVL